MLRRTCALVSIAFALSLYAAAGTAATSQRTFVASTGNDANPCSIAQPCRGFATAIVKTSPGGEVIVLDSAGYGPATISQSVSIVAPPGVYAGVSVFTGDGITVSAGPADTVVLHGLTINGQGGVNGIHVTSGKEIHIEDCTVANLAGIGISIEGGATVHIARADVRSNNGHGVFVQPSTAIAISTTLVDSILTSNAISGLFAGAALAGATVDAAVTRVTASNNGAGGFAVITSLGAVTMAVTDSVASGNGSGAGIYVSGTNATAIVFGSSLLRNALADLDQQNGAVLRTAGNNAVTGRGPADIAGTLTMNPLK